MAYTHFKGKSSGGSTGKRDKGSVRRSQLITTYGVGSIVPVGDESFMVAGIDRWPVSRPNLFEPRLQQDLKVLGFIQPPGEESGVSVPVIRFPRIYSCPTCKRLDRHGFFASFDNNKCGNCNEILVPSRFIIACSKGHIDDFPYHEWVHNGQRVDYASHKLSIDHSGTSAALRDIEISCSCGAKRSMDGSFLKRELKKVVKRCSGRRPWLGGDPEECKETPRTLQRGASNVYFAEVQSAISIPPWSEGAFKAINDDWFVLKNIPDEMALRGTIKGMGIAENTSYTVDDLVQAVLQRKLKEESDLSDLPRISLKDQEYQALVIGKKEIDAIQDFVCEKPEGGLDGVEDWFNQVMAVKRLREVRVLTGFTRLIPPNSINREEHAKLSKEALNWLPAIQVIGEGVFLRLNLDRLKIWENMPDVIERTDKINQNYKKHCASFNKAPDRNITGRFVLVHTLAHILINQWSLAAGYPAASLRERLYVNEDDIAAILIYTATSDSAGSLGGVVAQTEKGRLAVSLAEAVQHSSWCSADPLCIEADAAGVDSLNLAACHACILLPEVSCEEANTLLDRGLLVGTPEQPTIGFFESMVNKEQ